jgi:hypothetical protein
VKGAVRLTCDSGARSGTVPPTLPNGSPNTSIADVVDLSWPLSTASCASTRTSIQVLDAATVTTVKPSSGVLAGLHARLATAPDDQDGAVAEHLDFLAGFIPTVCDVAHRPDWPAPLYRTAGIVNSDTLMTILRLLLCPLLGAWLTVIVALEPWHDGSGSVPARTAARTGAFCWSRGTRRRRSPARKLLSTLRPDLLYGEDQDTCGATLLKRYRRLVSAEGDALPQEVLRGAFPAATAEFWNRSARRAVLHREVRDRRFMRTRWVGRD